MYLSLSTGCGWTGDTRTNKEIEMNQVRDWTGSCQRCYRTTNMHTMSMFDVSLICMKCADSERKHPQYSQAAEAERSEVKSGNRNFKGIGAPSELLPGMEWEQLENE